MIRYLLCASLVSMASIATATDFLFLEDFESGTSQAGWKFSDLGAPVIPDTGGNPGHYLFSQGVNAVAAKAKTTVGTTTPFTGDLRASGVTKMEVDAKTDSATALVGNERFTLILRKTNGTATATDDDYAYFVGPFIPAPGAGWKHFTFTITSQSTAALPPGWQGGSGTSPTMFKPGVTWNDVITNVDVVEFAWKAPSTAGVIQKWNVGIDNPSVTYTTPPCPEDLDGDGVVGQGDLGLLLASFGFDGGGDIDGDGDTDQADLGALLGAFGLPCPL